MTCPASFAGLVRWLVAISVVSSVPAVFFNIERLGLAFYFIQKQFCAGQGHGHTVTKMSAVSVEVGEARMPSDGGDVVRRTGTKACPMLHRHSVTPARENLAHALQQAVAPLNGGGFVEADIFQRAADQHMPIATRD